jgi:hypothetical protein
MAERLPIPPARIGEVATAALVDVRTVRHYRERWPLLRATEAAITRAVLALPADPQMEIPQIYSATPPSSTGESAGAITGTVEYACPGGRNAASPVSTKSKDPVSAPARAAAGGNPSKPSKTSRCAPPVRRRISVEIAGRSMTVDELARWEPGATPAPVRDERTS